MVGVKIAKFRDGAEFEPVVEIVDLEEYERAERDAKTPSGVAKAKLAFLEKILGRTANGKVELKLTVREISRAFDAVWAWSFAREEAVGPFG